MYWNNILFEALYYNVILSKICCCTSTFPKTTNILLLLTHLTNLGHYGQLLMVTTEYNYKLHVSKDLIGHTWVNKKFQTINQTITLVRHKWCKSFFFSLTTFLHLRHLLSRTNYFIHSILQAQNNTLPVCLSDLKRYNLRKLINRQKEQVFSVKRHNVLSYLCKLTVLFWLCF